MPRPLPARTGSSGIVRERHAAVLRRFLTACASGDLTELVTQLKDDVIVYTDGGGKGAVPNPIYGADKVSRLLLGLARKAPPGLSGGYPADIKLIYSVGGDLFNQAPNVNKMVQSLDGVEFLVELGLSSINIERRASGGDLNYQRRK